MSKQRTWYMHTVDGKPASYDGHQLTFVGGRHAATLVPTLAQIHREAQTSRRWRIKMGYDEPSDPYRYGHVLVRLPQ